MSVNMCGMGRPKSRVIPWAPSVCGCVLRVLFPPWVLPLPWACGRTFWVLPRPFPAQPLPCGRSFSPVFLCSGSFCLGLAARLLYHLCCSFLRSGLCLFGCGLFPALSVLSAAALRVRLVGTSKYRVLMGGRVMVMLCSKPCIGFCGCARPCCGLRRNRRTLHRRCSGSPCRSLPPVRPACSPRAGRG